MLDLSLADLFTPEERERGDRALRHRHLFRAGDTVTIHGRDIYSDRPETEVDFTGKEYPDGAEGVVVGFSIKSVSRFNRRPDRTPGIYRDPEWVFVRVGEWEVRHIRQNYLSLPEEVMEARLAEHRLAHSEFTGYGEFLRDLPETTFWEGDVVTLRPTHTKGRPTSGRDKEFVGGFPDNPAAYVIGWMSFHYRSGDIVESLDHGPRYSLSDRLHQCSGGSYWDFQLELVERGNLWRRAHGEPLVFRDLAEESIFALRIGEAAELGTVHASPSRPDGRAAAIKLVKAGEGDGILWHSDFVDWSTTDYYTLVRFADRDLGARVRAATLTGEFELPSSDDPPNE